MLTAIVLSAGLSQRMGNFNKLLLKYKSKTIVETTLENILASQVNEVIVVTGYETEKLKEAVSHLPVTIIYNQDYAKGMTTSIQCGIERAKESGYMICLADMFMITALEYVSLKKAFEKDLASNSRCICVPRYNNEKGNPVIFSPYYKDLILEHKEMDGCKTIVQTNKENICWVNMPTDHVLQDMDYYEDYEKLIKSNNSWA
jgi:molybdenum cofactor cytidylyltransferase